MHLSLQEQEEVHAVALPLTQEPSQQLVPHNKGKGKAKTMEDDEDEEGEATQKLRKELEDFVVLTKFDNKLLASLLPPLSEYYEEDIGLLRGAKILDGRKGDITLVLPAMVTRKRGKAKTLLGDSEKAGTKRSFKSTELVDSNSDEEKEEDRVCVIKKIKCEHVEEPTGTRKRKEIIELEDEEVEIVAPKTPVAGPLHQTSKSMVLVPSTPKPIPKLIIALASPVAGPSTAPIVPSSVPKPAASAASTKPAPVKSAGPAIGGSVRGWLTMESQPRGGPSKAKTDDK
ncbi:hypothetical protein C0995_008176 [Termitomyces sp. Mi166|nr:hypothetical protein C0995_008176 [Termitomyces sp. Mi166\